jgi:hypothetical protein
MEKIGLINRILTRQELNYRDFQALHNSKEAINHNEGLQETLKLLKEVKTFRDIRLALNIERLLLTQEIQLYANSPEETRSVQTAIAQLQDAENAFNVVQNPQAYQEATKTYPAKQKEAGLPMDSFRTFIKSHSTRLQNRMASPLPVPEKNIFRQRRENMSMVKDVYMHMQRQALGLESPAKTKGLGM